MRFFKHAVFMATASFVGLGFASAYAAEADGQDIVVTATKRSESINDVPMSINAIGGEDLKVLGVRSTDDLARVVPGFTFAQSTYSAPVYSIRGIGFYDYSIGAVPAVTVYQDEAPLTFATMTRGSAFDLERVEVLKGPQGLFFGSNSTGGAVNYIAAKPTRTLKAGIDASYGNYGAYQLGGFVSGPVSDTLAVRLALSHEGGDAWQRSTTSSRENGARDFTQGRFLVDWTPTDRLSLALSLDAFSDKSDAQAGQLIAVNPLLPPFVDPTLATRPLVTKDARAADWSSARNPSRDDQMYRGALRVDYDLTDAVKLTSLTSVAHYEQDDFVDPDATTLEMVDTRDEGSINAFSQELRLSGDVKNSKLRWLVGANYELNRVRETQTLRAVDASGFRSFNIVFGVPTPDDVRNFTNQRFENKAAFGNIDYDVTDQITLHGGLRYTDSSINFSGCTSDTANGSLGTVLNIILGASYAFTDCTTLNAALVPALSKEKLDEDNVSWRVGADYKLNDDVLFYGNASRGFKSGSFPLLPATSTEQYTPVTQEDVLAYELGFKAKFPDQAIQLNGAVFYYDYTDKQVLGSVVLAPNIFGPLNRLNNLPDSSITGAELDVQWRPLSGLSLNLGATYIDSEIGNYTDYDPFGLLRNFKGEAFPNTPDWQVNAGAEYAWSVAGLAASIGGNVTYRSETNGALGDYKVLAIDSYTLLDLHAGIGAPDDRWAVTLWGRNVTDEYYWSNAYKIADVSGRFAGMPATYGVRFAARY